MGVLLLDAVRDMVDKKDKMMYNDYDSTVIKEGDIMINKMKTIKLFQGIEEEKLRDLQNCLRTTIREYQKDNYIFMKGNIAQYVGVILTGGAHIVQEDCWGNRVILAKVSRGDLFGEAFSCAEVQELPVSVVATEKSEIMLVDYRRIIRTCGEACSHHRELIKNMMGILAQKNIMLTQKMEHITKRTLREKLLSYLSTQAHNNKTNKIQIPFNRQELADYLCTDRSALSRELSQMQKENLIKYHKNQFILKVKESSL